MAKRTAADKANDRRTAVVCPAHSEMTGFLEPDDVGKVRCSYPLKTKRVKDVRRDEDGVETDLSFDRVLQECGKVLVKAKGR